MKVLLDTNAVIRLITGIQFPESAHRVLAHPTTEYLVSIVSPWEIALKPKLGLTPADVERGIACMAAQILPIRLVHIEELSRLPWLSKHRDPFDRLLIAQALSEGLPIISSDGHFPEYPRLEVIWR